MKVFSIFALLLLPFFSPEAFAQCEETDENRVLLVGDSWAFFMGVDQTINTVFERWGHSNYKYLTNAILSENGAETDDFLQADKQNEIAAQLDAHPEIKAVHLSLGGNDVLGSWNVDFTPYETDSLIDTVMSRLLTITDFIKTTQPGIRIFWSGYVYPNFGEVIDDTGILQTLHPFYGTWEGMGFPTFLQLNEILNTVSGIVEEYAANDPDVDFVNATGLIQHTFGQPTNLGVPPGGAYAPFQAPLPAGYPDYPSPMSSMRNYGIFLDCFHLSAQAYRDFISYHTQKFYHKFLMGDQYFLGQSGSVEGSVKADGTIEPGTLKMGSFNGETYRSIITFNTSDLPAAGVTKASLFLRRSTLLGNNPLDQGLHIKIMNGNFGSTINLEPEDYNAPANATTSPCFFGSSSDNGHWIRVELPQSVLGLIDNSGTVQFMLVAPQSVSDGVITFSNSNDPDFAPVLSVNHEFITSTAELPDLADAIEIYPNPTTGVVNISADGIAIREIRVVNAHGQEVLISQTPNSTVEIGQMPIGVYFLRIVTTQGSVVKRIVKQ